MVTDYPDAPVTVAIAVAAEAATEAPEQEDDEMMIRISPMGLISFGTT
jgi:hypothetical protein